MKFAANDKSYAMGIKGSNDQFELAYNGNASANLDSTTLMTITSGGNAVFTGTTASATGSTVGDLTLADGGVIVVAVLFLSEMKTLAQQVHLLQELSV